MIQFLLAAAVAASTQPAALFALERTAVGGDALNGIAEIVERGTYSGGGLTGPYVSYTDPKTGYQKVAIVLAGSVQGQGYDAKGPWQQQGTLVEPVDDAATIASSKTAAYVARNGWWKPQTDAATFQAEGTKDDGGKTCDVVRVTPHGGDAVDVWLDASTHLIAKTVETNKSNVTTTTAYSDYRAVHGVQHPFAATISTGDAKYDQHAVVTSVDFLAHANVADFTRPKNRRTATIAGGTSTMIPFDMDDPLRDHIVIPVRVNGSRTLHMIFDTGGSNVVSPAVAREIGLHGAGSIPDNGAGEQTLSVQLAGGAVERLGAATLSDQQFDILPLPSSITYMPGRYQIDGIVGYEVLKNFIVSIDYVHRRLTLTDPKAFVPPAGATAIHFRSATVPVVPAKLDGVPGWFMFDTGNAFYNTVSQQFLTAHGLAPAFNSNVLVQSSGNIGGALRDRIARASTLQVGPYTVKRPVFAVTNTTKGALAGSAFSGNIGQAVISRFDIALDYVKNVIYWKPNARFNRPFVGTLDGMSLHMSDSGAVLVSYVNPHSPASAAALVAGDRIVSANGVSAQVFGESGLAIMEQTGKPIAIAFERNGVRHRGTLVPKEMLP